MSKNLGRYYVRTQSDWLQITLIDTMFNKIYFCLKQNHLDVSYFQTILNMFYDPNGQLGKAVYNNKGINKQNKLDAYVDPSDWSAALKSRINLYQSVQKIVGCNNLDKTNHSYCYKYLLGIRDVLRNIVIK